MSIIHFIILPLIFILYEVYKLVNMESHWCFVFNKVNNQIFNVGELLYATFIFSLYFTASYWWVGLFITLLSFLSAHKLSEHVIESVFLSDKPIKRYMLIEGLITIFAYSSIILMETLKSVV
jgi:hypothetical protein